MVDERTYGRSRLVEKSPSAWECRFERVKSADKPSSAVVWVDENEGLEATWCPTQPEKGRNSVPCGTTARPVDATRSTWNDFLDNEASIQI